MQSAIIHSAKILEIEAYPVLISVRLSQAVPLFGIGGVSNDVVAEVQGRVKSSIKYIGHQYPTGKIEIAVGDAAVNTDTVSLITVIGIGQPHR